MMPVKTDRPWQATALGVIDILATIFSFLFAILLFFMQDFLIGIFSGVDVQGVEGADSAMSILTGFATGFGVLMLGFGVLYIFMARGAFKGQKWSPIVSIVFGILAVLGILTNFDNTQIVSLVIDLFTLYCAFVCVKSPYFQK